MTDSERFIDMGGRIDDLLIKDDRNEIDKYF